MLEFAVSLITILEKEKNRGVPESLADHLKSALFIIFKVLSQKDMTLDILQSYIGSNI